MTHNTLKKVKDATKIVSGFIDYFPRKNEAGETFVHLETCTNHIIMFYLMRSWSLPLKNCFNSRQITIKTNLSYSNISRSLNCLNVHFDLWKIEMVR